MKNTKLYKRIVSRANIYLAIYSMESYIFEKDLLSENDYKLYYDLKDKFSDKVNTVIDEVKKLLEEILINDECLTAQVYLRPKKVDDNIVSFRPIHSSCLKNQIAIVSMLNCMIYDINYDRKEIYLNELAKIIPDNFYGNIPSENPDFLFIPWQNQYKRFSNDITSAYSKYIESNEYKYEISLDLVNFFPSINPNLVYKKIVGILCHKFIGNEFEMLKRTLKKLLFIKIDNLKSSDAKNLYYENSKSKSCYCKGIPQGLPQAYFFGNLIMVDIAEKFKKYFPGNSFYYVDDSVIYTNAVNSERNFEDDFIEKIKQINCELSAYSKIDNVDKDSKDSNINDNYLIKVHGDTAKSSIIEIKQIKIGQSLINLLCKEASMGSTELKTVFTEIEDITLLNKFTELLKLILKEIDRVKSENEHIDENDQKYYLKLLNRFKKFFRFRIRLIEYKKYNYISSKDQNFLTECLKLKENGDTLQERTRSFFEAYDEDIFLTELRFVLKNSEDFNIKIRENVIDFESELFANYISDYKEISYFSKMLNVTNYIHDLEKNKNDDYFAIKRRIIEKSPNYYDTFYKNQEKALMEMISSIKTIGINDWCAKFDNRFESENEFVVVCFSSDQLYRMVLNCFISNVFNIEIDDNKKVIRRDRKSLHYKELRLIQRVRNNNFCAKEFIDFCEKIMAEKYLIIDYSIFEVIDYFHSYVKDPYMIDDLILVHKYVSEMWKNGSKFLHFYTLHNQEHAVALIKSISLIIKAIDFFQLSKIDFYILFLSCYLHDISMVSYTDISMFGSDKDKSNMIYSSFIDKILELKQEIYLSNFKEVKGILIDIYKCIDEYFESNIRSTHARDSANCIIKTSDIEFIKDNIKEMVAEISHSHGFDSNEVYGIKSNGNSSIYNKKYLMILLRFSDLLDMSENRVTLPILANNIQYMSHITIFHWLSHKSISGYEINVNYNINSSLYKKAIRNKKSFLENGAIHESIEITIFLNRFNNLATNKILCKGIQYKNMNENGEFSLTFNKNNKELCKEDKCHFLCKWMVHKNEYLINELKAVNVYLSRTNNNLFKTKIKLIYKFTDDAQILSNDEFDRINCYLSRCE